MEPVTQRVLIKELGLKDHDYCGFWGLSKFLIIGYLDPMGYKDPGAPGRRQGDHAQVRELWGGNQAAKVKDRYRRVVCRWVVSHKAPIPLP